MKKTLFIPSQMNLSLAFTSRGVWVRYFMESWFPFVPHPVTSSLPHMPALSFLVLPGKWWSQWIPEPSPSSRAQNAPSLASNAVGENATHVSWNPGYTEHSDFVSFLQEWSYKLFAWSYHD